MIDVRPNAHNEEHNKYICPTEGCNLIPEIISVHAELGLIVLKCSDGHTNEINVENYFKKLNEKKRITPEGDDIDNAGEISEADVLNSKKSVENKIDLLSDIIKTHEQIIQTQELYPENYFHNQNIINIADFIKEVKEAKVPKDNNANETIKIDDIIKEIEAKKEKEDENIEKLANEYGIQLDKNEHINKELNLVLKGPKTEDKYKKLGDDGFKLLSQIIFKNLIGLNLANNDIKDISPLNDMLLPHLENIDLSNNKIVDIKPVANLVSEDLSEIYLQNNQIKDLGPFLNSDFLLIEIFRVDGNKEAIDKNSFKAVREKYKKIGCNIMFEPKKWDDFAKKYNFDINTKEFDINDKRFEKIDLGSRRDEEILRDLKPLIISPNKIRCLILDDNKLENVSLLKRMPLYNLVELDLSLNFITSIRFLKRMTKFKKLKTLYLNDNKINDISPFEKYNEGEETFPSTLEILTLKNNCLDLNDSITRDILKTLINSTKLTFDYEEKELKLEENEGRGTTGNAEIQ